MTMNSGTDGAKMTNKHNGERGHGAGSVPKGIFLGAFAGFAAQAAGNRDGGIYPVGT